MMTYPPIRLLDAPLIDAPTRRALLVKCMAADLVRYEAAHNEQDAIRSLYGTGRYEMADIVMLLDDARQAAVQEIVAREMAQS